MIFSEIIYIFTIIVIKFNQKLHTFFRTKQFTTCKLKSRLHHQQNLNSIYDNSNKKQLCITLQC